MAHTLVVRDRDSPPLCVTDCLAGTGGVLSRSLAVDTGCFGDTGGPDPGIFLSGTLIKKLEIEGDQIALQQTHVHGDVIMDTEPNHKRIISGAISFSLDHSYYA